MLRAVSMHVEVSMTQLELDIIYDGLKELKSDSYPSERRRMGAPDLLTRTDYIDLLEQLDITLKYLNTKFCDKDKPSYKSEGDHLNCVFLLHDVILILQAIKEYTNKKKPEPKPKNLTENPEMKHVYKHHVDRLLKDFNIIESTFKCGRLNRVYYD